MKKSKYNFFNDNGLLRLVDVDPESVIEKIEAKVYKVAMDKTGPVLVPYANKFEIPELLGERIKKHIGIVGRGHGRATAPYGVLITGPKGTGKTLLGKAICNMYLEKYEQPVLYVEQAVPTELLEILIKNIGDVCVFFNEYAKRHGSRKEDGSIVSTDQHLEYFERAELGKILNVITENNAGDMDQYLIGRTSRIKNHFKYDKISNCEIDACLESFNVDENYRPFIRGVALASNLNMDVLTDICKDLSEDLTLYEDIEGYLDTLNIDDYCKPGIVVDCLDVKDTVNYDWVKHDVKVSLNKDMSVTIAFGDEVKTINPSDVKQEDNKVDMEEFRLVFGINGSDNEVSIPKKMIINKIKENIEDDDE